MNCVNCGCRLTFFNETDELWSGTDRALCVSCRKKITPFLEEPAQPDNLTHLRDRRDALIARGVTPEGYAHLTEYCRHLDALLEQAQALRESVPGAFCLPQPSRNRLWLGLPIAATKEPLVNVVCKHPR